MKGLCASCLERFDDSSYRYHCQECGDEKFKGKIAEAKSVHFVGNGLPGDSIDKDPDAWRRGEQD